jgi:tRNA(Ile)-lysidine synthase
VLLDRCTFPAAGSEAVAAVSGGADSVALLALAVDAGVRVTAVHVDHGLRPGSADEADVVRDVASALGAAFRAARVDLVAGPNLEARARDARRAVLGPDAMTGHTADDQAETVVLNLVRGAGLDGLAGMRRGATKPILALRRHETRSLCVERGFVTVDDPTNAEPVFRRNRVRHEVLPLLDEIACRDVAVVLARNAEVLADDADLLDALAAAIDPADARALAAAPVPLARRAVRRWLAGEHPPDLAAVDRVLAVARGEIRATEVADGVRVGRSAGRLLRSAR